MAVRRLTNAKAKLSATVLEGACRLTNRSGRIATMEIYAHTPTNAIRANATELLLRAKALRLCADLKKRAMERPNVRNGTPATRRIPAMRAIATTITHAQNRINATERERASERHILARQINA